MGTFLLLLCFYMVGSILALISFTGNTNSETGKSTFFSQVVFEDIQNEDSTDGIVFSANTKLLFKRIHFHDPTLMMMLYPNAGYEDRLSCWIRATIENFYPLGPKRDLSFTMAYCEKFNCTKPLAVMFEENKIDGLSFMNELVRESMLVEIECIDISQIDGDEVRETLSFHLALAPEHNEMADVSITYPMWTNEEVVAEFSQQMPCHVYRPLYFVAQKIGDTPPNVIGQQIQFSPVNEELACNHVTTTFKYLEFHPRQAIPEKKSNGIHSLMVNGVPMAFSHLNFSSDVIHQMGSDSSLLRLQFFDKSPSLNCKAFVTLESPKEIKRKKGGGTEKKKKNRKITSYVISSFTQAHVNEYMEIIFIKNGKGSVPVHRNLHKFKLNFQLNCGDEEHQNYFFTARLYVSNPKESINVKNRKAYLSKFEGKVEHSTEIASMFVAIPTGPKGIVKNTDFARRLTCGIGEEFCYYEKVMAYKGEYPYIPPQPSLANAGEGTKVDDVSPSGGPKLVEDQQGCHQSSVKQQICDTSEVFGTSKSVSSMDEKGSSN